jgi:hypothetical protein
MVCTHNECVTWVDTRMLLPFVVLNNQLIPLLPPGHLLMIQTSRIMKALAVDFRIAVLVCTMTAL